MFAWDPGQYSHFADDRSRPFYDLVARIGAPSPARVVDLGCGDGRLTATLSTRWPHAQIVGIDSSPEMLARAAEYATDRVGFRRADVASLAPDADAEVVLSNALLQWVPGHDDLLGRWAAVLPAGAWLAFQVPGNFQSPSHQLMREVAAAPWWADRLAGVLRHDDAVATPADYARLFMTQGWTVDAWETTYLHVLSGADPVLDWVRGTGLRPVLAALTPADAAEFEAEYAQRLRAAYPSEAFGTLFAFRRIFCVGHRPG